MPLRDLLLAGVIVLLWGCNFIVVKVALADIPPFMFTGMRFLFVALLVVPFVRLPRSHLPWILGLSVTFGTLNFGLGFTGFAGLDAATGAILAQLGVPFSTMLAVIFLKDKLGIWRTGGLVLALSGAVVLAGEPHIPDIVPLLCVVGGCFFWAVSNLIMKKMPPLNALAITGWSSLFAAPQVALLSWLFEDGQAAALASATPETWARLAYVVVGATILAHSSWFYLLSRHPMSTIAPVSLLPPVIGVAGGILFLGEPAGWHKFVGGALTLAGLAVILLRQSRRGDVPAPPLVGEPVREEMLPEIPDEAAAIVPGPDAKAP